MLIDFADSLIFPKTEKTKIFRVSWGACGDPPMASFTDELCAKVTRFRSGIKDVREVLCGFLRVVDSGMVSNGLGRGAVF